MIYRRNADGSFMTDANGGKMYDYGANSGILVNGVRPVFEDENAYGSLFLYDIYNLRTDFNASLYATIDISDNLTDFILSIFNIFSDVSGIIGLSKIVIFFI